MTDRELLEMAAKAAGILGQFGQPNSHGGLDYADHFFASENSAWACAEESSTWNPLTNDGDALRLAVKLDIQIWRRPGGVEGIHNGSVLTNSKAEPLMPDPYAATRRAIVRAAADIEKLKSS